MPDTITAPGGIIGYRKDGRPICLLAGGSEEAPPSGEQQPPAEEQPPGEAEQNTPPAESDQLGDKGQKALEQERKDRKAAEKAAKELSDRLKAIEDQDKSELEKAQSRLAELEEQYGQERAQRLRFAAASEHGIPADYLDLLTGTDEETLSAQAVKVAELVKAKQAPQFAPNPGQGSGKGQQPPDTRSQIAAAESSGDYRTAEALKAQQLAELSETTK